MAFAIQYSIAGTAPAGTTVTYTGPVSGSVIATASGTYSITGIQIGTYTLTASLTGSVLSPSSVSVTLTGFASQATGIDFTAAPGYSISGALGVLGSGATVYYANAGPTISGSVTADINGNYSILTIPADTYTIQPAKTSYIFSPTTRNETITDISLTGVDFTCSPQYTLSGNAGVAAALVSYAGPTAGTVVADGSGNYSIPVASGIYNVTPSLTGYTFSPANTSIIILGGNVTGVDFTATATLTISGSAGAAGVTVSWTGPVSGSTTADGSGNYSIPDVVNGTYIITPSSANYIFSPTSATEVVSGSDITGVDFTATAIYSVSGNAGVAGALIMYAGTHQSGSVSSDSAGDYTIPGLQNDTYTITPVLATWTFSPTNSSQTVSGANITGVNFTATGINSITGNAGVASATVAWSGTQSGSTTADGSGNFTISNLGNGPFTIVPSLSGYVFIPVSAPLTIDGADITGVNFTALLVYNITGSAGVAYASVTYAGTYNGSVTADGSGNFTLSVPNGTYTITPVLVGYVFNPISAFETVSGAGISGVDFTATAIIPNVGTGAGATANLLLPLIATAQNYKEITFNTDIELLDEAMNGTSVIVVPAVTSYTVEQAIALYSFFMNFSGAPGSGVTIVLPSGSAKMWVVVNNTTSTETLLFTVGSGALQVSITDSDPHLILSDGANSVYQVS